MNILATSWRFFVFIASAVILALLFAGVIETSQGQTTSPTCVLTASPQVINEGESALLSWTTNATNTASITIEGVPQDMVATSTTTGLAGASGTISVSPTSDTTYTATIRSGPDGTVTCQDVVVVQETTPVPSSINEADTLPTPYLLPNIDINPFPTIETLNQGQTATTPSPTTQQPGVTTTTAPVMNDSSQVNPEPYPLPGTTPAPMVIDANSDGTILIRGTAKMVESNTMTIQSWGGEWIIRTNTFTTVIPNGTTQGSLSSISQGDFVGIDGTVATDQVYTIDANLIRNWTTNPFVPN